MNAIHIVKHYKGIRVSQARLVELIDGICRRFGVKKATINVGIVGDDEITRLNREFLNHKGTTDCLSFDLSEEAEGRTVSCRAKRSAVETSGLESGVAPFRSQIPPLRPSASGRNDKEQVQAEARVSGARKQGAIVFDLIVNGEMARRQAAERGHSSGAELALYITHALLHQLGFDDGDEKSAGRMHREEDEILQYFGYGTVYNT
jgi:rRNA maturation RNase YbeY